MKLHSTYKGVQIYKAESCGFMLQWSAYINGLFHCADTLAGIKKMISEA
jgi:hypothetical protein